MNKENKNRILTELSTSEIKKNNGKVNWEEILGMELELFYNGEIYKVKVINYENKRLWVDYNGYVYDKGVDIRNFNNGQFGNILKIGTSKFKYERECHFKDDERDMIITDREYRIDKSGIKRKWYKYTCNKCGWTEGWIEESSLIKNVGCACCSGHKLVPHINSIKVKATWMIDLGVSKEDALKYTCCSNKKIEVICPNCGNKKFLTPNNIYKTKSIGCNCGDRLSYPEKIMHSVLKQINIEYKTQLSKTTFKWCDKYKYDFYLPYYNMIIETHGLQHYEENKNWNMSLREVQENDKNKEELALNNGIYDYIVIDCRYSEFDFIKNSILNSKLNSLFDLSKVDWIKCEEFALKNIVKEVCEYWNNKEEWETTVDVGKVFNLGKKTISRYLKKGNFLEWCNYNSDDERIKGRRKSVKVSCKPVEIYKDGILLGTFESCAELERQSNKLFGVKLGKSAISKVCRGINARYKGYTFKYALCAD